MTETSPPARPRHAPWEEPFIGRGPQLLKAFIIVVVGAIVLFPTLNSPFYGDDDLYLVNNPLFEQPDRLWKAWFQPGSFIEYYPIDQTVQWLQWRCWGVLSAFPYHLTNLVLHLTSALLIWRFLGKLGLKLAWLGGLIFAIHPMLVDSIAAACELKNTLSLPPFLLAMCCYLDFEMSVETKYYLRAVALFLVAMLCKISMFFFPIIILLYAWWKRGRIGWADWKASLPFFAISIVLGLMTLYAGVIYAVATQYQSPGLIHLGGVWDRIALAGLCLGFYFGHCFLPLHPIAMYPLWSMEPLTPQMFLPWLGILLVLIVCWRRRESWGRPALVGLAFFVLGVAPFLGFYPTSYMCLTWVADHFVYIPIIGLIGLVVAGFENVGRRIPKRIVPLGIGCLTLALGLLALQSYSYARLFPDPQKLWIYNLRYAPDSWLGRYQLGVAYYATQEPEKALAQLQESCRINTLFYNSNYFLGLSFRELGKYAEAIDALERAVKVSPNHPEPHYVLAVALMQAGRVPESIEQFEIVSRMEPDSSAVLYGLSYALEHEKRFPEAIAQIEAALKIAPTSERFKQRLNELQNEQLDLQKNPPPAGHFPAK